MDEQHATGMETAKAVVSDDNETPSWPDTGSASKVDGIVIGRIVRQDATGTFVECEGLLGGEPLLAISTVEVTTEHLGREVALAFQGGDSRLPVILGLIHSPAPEAPVELTPEETEVEVERDGERVTLSADKEIVLKCGKASITLTRSGKILLRGTYLLNRSSGVNRIKGGSVQIN